MSDRWMRRVLDLAPREFRQKYADELLATYAERERAAAGRGRRIVFQMRELWGALVLLARLHLGIQRGSDPHGPLPEGSLLRATWQDMRFAARTLRRSPGFAGAAVLVLGLGIGATSAIFSAVNAYFFRPLPFAEPDRLVTVFETNPELGWVDQTASPANLLDWRERSDAFADVSGYADFGSEVTTYQDGEPSVLAGKEVLGNFFSTLGVTPVVGRAFRFEETWLEGGGDRVVILSHDLWVNRFGADPGVVGQSMDFADGPREIVGVMPQGFHFPDDDVQLWYPVGWDAEDREDASFRRAHYLRAFARLAPEVSLQEADASLQAVVRRLQDEYPETNRVMGAGIMMMREFLTRDVRSPLVVLLGAGALLLLLACANVANLQLVRANERDRELALRRALGAGRARVVRQMLIESVLLAGLGGAVGLGLGWMGIRSLDGLTRVGIEGATALALDHRIVLFTLAAAALSAILFGVAPAIKAGWSSPDGTILERARGSSAKREHLRAAGTLVSVQVALALLLVVGAGLMARSSWLLSRVDPGFDPEGVLAIQLPVQTVRYPDREDVVAFYDRLTAALEARPDIDRVGVVGKLPLDGPNWSSQFQAEGWPADRVGFEILHRRADRGYFETLRVPLVRGRMLEPSDRAGAPRVVVVNEAFAREHFPGEEPIGKRIAYTRAATTESTWFEIVGIVRDQRQERLARPARPEVFESRYQDWGRNDWVVIRGNGAAPLDLVPVVREVLEELDPMVPLGAIRPLESVREASVAREQLMLRLLATFGATALLLATVGVYAVTSRAARRRTQEIGIRMALGAGTKDVRRLMLRHGFGLVGVGLGAGLVGALLATRALTSLLYGIEPHDPLTLAAVVALLGGVALLASYLPARRAAVADPVESLRGE